MDEKLLVAQLQDARTVNQGFQTLLKLYKERLYWHIRTLVLDHDDADDVLQETFIKVYKHINSFKGNSRLYSWLYRIATNESLNHLKKKAKHLKIADEELQQLMVDNLKSDPHFDGDEAQILLQKAITQLPEKQQMVFKMRYFEDLKYEEISEIMETSVGALKANYHHAVKKVEGYLSQN